MLTIEQIKQTVTDYFKDKPVKRVYLFGSYARGDANENSDVDLLVEYNDKEKMVSFFDILRMQTDLDKYLRKRVQLVENGTVYYRFVSYIEKDKLKLYEA